MYRFPKDLQYLIYKFIHNDLYKKVKDQYHREWGLDTIKRYLPDSGSHSDDMGHSYSYNFKQYNTGGRVYMRIYHRLLETCGGAFTKSHDYYLSYEHGNDEYRYIRWGSHGSVLPFRRGYNDAYWQQTQRRFIYRFKGSFGGRTSNENDEDLIPLPPRYKYSNGGFLDEMKYIPFEQRSR